MFFSRPHKIGLALGSGGPKGLAHIGVLRALTELKIPISYISGCSIGSVIGGIYAMTGSIESLDRTLNVLNRKSLFSIFSDINLRSGMIRGDKALAIINQMVGEVKIEDLKIPFQSVATIVDTGEPITLYKGLLSQAIRASSSVPYMFEPIKIHGHVVVDGAVGMPVPVPLLKPMGATKIIAVNLDQPAYPYYDVNNDPQLNLRYLTIGAAYLLQANLAKEQMKSADVIVQPNIPPMIKWAKLIDGSDLIEEGYKATMEKKKEILALLS